MKNQNTPRTQTIANSFGVIYTIGQSFTMHMNMSNYSVPVVITEITESGTFFKVSGSTKLFSIRTLQSKGSKIASGYYLIKK